MLGRVLGRPAVLPLPAFAVRTIFGEMGEGVLLAGQHVAPKRLLASGFRFLREDLEAALRFELGK
jgi:NAD dependent epimerase/dehydratase family enzyme